MLADSLFSSDLTLLVILVACFGAVFFVVNFLMGTRARSQRDRALAQRLGGKAAKSDSATDMPSSTQFMPEAIAQVGQKFASSAGFSAKLDDRLERAGLPVASGEFVALTAVCALVGGVVAAIFLLNPIFVLLIAGIAGMIPNIWLKRAEKKRKNALTEQLADTMSILASSLRAGYSFLQALDTVSKEIGEPSATEFQRVVAEIRLGRPVEDALIAMGERVGSADLKWAVIAINVQRQVGGNLAEVLDIVAGTVRERAYIRRQVMVLSAEGRISVGILAAIPFFLLIYISIVNSDYIKPLFTTTPGLILVTIGGICLALGIYIMTRMIKIDV
jgi:tight adherence protein B